VLRKFHGGDHDGALAAIDQLRQSSEEVLGLLDRLAKAVAEHEEVEFAAA